MLRTDGGDGTKFLVPGGRGQGRHSTVSVESPEEVVAALQSRAESLTSVDEALRGLVASLEARLNRGFSRTACGLMAKVGRWHPGRECASPAPLLSPTA